PLWCFNRIYQLMTLTRLDTKVPFTVSRRWLLRCFQFNIPTQDKAKFPDSFIERILELEYPHLFFLPRCEVLPVDSILRMDACQSVFTNRLEATGVTLDESANELRKAQFQSVIAGEPYGYYQLFREEILNKKQE